MIDLSQFPMHKKPYSDGTLIQWSKSELIEYIRLIEGNYKTLYQVYIQSVKNAEELLGSRDPAPHWIPVTERLPKRYESVLTTIRIIMPSGDMELRVCENFLINEKSKDWSKGFSPNVTAWMPRPAPYQGGE